MALKPDPFAERNRRIVELYTSGLSLQEVGTMVGLSHERVRQIMQAGGISTRSNGEETRLLVQRQEGKEYRRQPWLAVRVRAGQTVPQMAQEAGVCDSTIHTWLRRYGLHASWFRVKISHAYLSEEYTVQERSMADIATELGCVATTVYKRLIRYGIPTRGRGKHRRHRSHRGD